jgi:hypothetical protein
MSMGRKHVIRTKEEINERNNAKRMRYYWRNAKQERDRALERYYRRKDREEIQPIDGYI